MSEKEKVKEIFTKMKEEAQINEAYLVGLLWGEVEEGYGLYHSKLEEDSFLHDEWQMFFNLGKKMYLDGVSKFDDITIMKYVKDYNIQEIFDENGGLETITEAIYLTKSGRENIDYYYNKVKDVSMIRELYNLFGMKIFKDDGKYQWDKMTRRQMYRYWLDKVHIADESEGTYEVENLYVDYDTFKSNMEEETAEVLPYYKSHLLNSISGGSPRGAITAIGGYGGTGKSSIAVEKIVMSWIANNERGLVILNEEDAQAFRQKTILSIMWNEMSTGISRKKMMNGTLSNEDNEKLKKAFDKFKELIGGQEPLIKIVFLERYTIDNLETLVRLWSNRGYYNLLIDTHKVADDAKGEQRWVSFVEDTKKIYKLTRKNAGGLNLRTILTFQLSDSSMNNRVLDFQAIGEGRASKNEMAIVYMFRAVWGDEYAGGKNELYVFKNIKNEKGEYEKQRVNLESGKPYYLLFTAKNRRGATNDTGQPVLVIEPNFNNNHFKEIGWTTVKNDKGTRR